MRRFSSPRSPRSPQLPLLPLHEDTSPGSPPPSSPPAIIPTPIAPRARSGPDSASRSPLRTPRSSRSPAVASAASVLRPLSSTDGDATSGSPRSRHADPAASVLDSPPALPHVVTDAQRDELLACARQTRYLERWLQAQLDAQSAGLLAGLGLDGDDASSQASEAYRDRSRRGEAQGERSCAGEAYRDRSRAPASAASSPQRPPSRYAVKASSPAPSGRLALDDVRPAPLPTTRRAIHGTLLELANLKKHEADTLSQALQPLDAFLANAASLSEQKTRLDAAIAARDTPVAWARATSAGIHTASDWVTRMMGKVAATMARQGPR